MPTRLLIIGGVAGGMSAAARARRLDESASIIVLEKSGFVSFANCGLPYHIAGRIEQESKLLVAPVAMVRSRFNIDARVHHEAIRIDRQNKVVEVRDLDKGSAYSLPYDKLILAPGANPIVPPIPHVDAANVFLLRNMEDTRRIQGFLKQSAPKRGVIVGAGFIGLEMAEALVDRGLQVTIVEKAPHPLPMLDAEMAKPIASELAKHGVTLVAGSGLASFKTEGDRVTHVVTEDGRSIEADLVLLSIGVRPNVGLAQAAELKLGPSGAIAVDAFQRTSDPDIYAVGDAAEVVHGVSGKPARIPLAGPANRQGRAAGEHAVTGSATPAGKVFGTAIVRVFELSIGTTGLSAVAARQAGFDADASYVLPNHHAGYYPGAQALRIKLVYDRATGKILGAQISGKEGVDKRLDVIATAMHFGATIDDLTQLDLAYAPQFGSAKDPVHLAGFVAQNQFRQLMPAADPDQREGATLVDVRTPEEYAAGTLPGAVNIPVDELRQRLGELDPNQEILVFCKVGQRGFVAQRILHQHGFGHVRNLKGGYSLISEK